MNPGADGVDGPGGRIIGPERGGLHGDRVVNGGAAAIRDGDTEGNR